MLRTVVFTTVVFAVTAVASDKTQICTLLTEAEVAAAVPLKPLPPLSHSEISEKAPFKGEKLERCNWPLGDGGKAGNVYLMTGSVKNEEQRKAARAGLDDMGKRTTAAGGTSETKEFGSVKCLSANAPKQPSVVTCLAEKGDRSISITALATNSLTVEKVKTLLDLATGRVK